MENLRHRVTIQRAKEAQNSFGEPVLEWQDVGKVWARVEDLSGREYFAARQVAVAEVTTRVTIRWRDDVKPSMRILAGSRVLDVRSVIDPDGRRRELQLMCREVVS